MFEVITEPALNLLESNNVIKLIHDIGREEVRVSILHSQIVKGGANSPHTREDKRSYSGELSSGGSKNSSPPRVECRAAYVCHHRKLRGALLCHLAIFA